jgi:isopentenyldiphosphate isomerase
MGLIATTKNVGFIYNFKNKIYMDELIDIVDFHGNPTGKTCLKSIAHKEGLWHSCIHVWMVNESDQVLVQLRGEEVAISPNKWDLSVAGHIGAGELPIDAAVREIQEEIGLTLSPKDLFLAAKEKCEVIHENGLIDNGFYYLYLCKTNFKLNQLVAQKEEVAALKLLKLSEIEAMVQQENSEFVDRGMEYYQLVFKELRAFLKKA